MSEAIIVAMIGGATSILSAIIMAFGGALIGQRNTGIREGILRAAFGGLIGLFIGVFLGVYVAQLLDNERVVIPEPTIHQGGNAFDCGCIPEDGACGGVPIDEGERIAPSSILEPAPPNKDKIYIYWETGIATEKGTVWTYIDGEGRPATKSCVNSQRIFFPQAKEVIEIGN